MTTTISLQYSIRINRLESKMARAAIFQKILSVTHDQHLGLSLADRMAIMNDGAIVQIGAPREVYRAPANAFVASFIGETNFIEGRISAQSNGAAEIETAVGILHTTTIYHEFANGEIVTCSIRPESIHIHNEMPSGVPNRLSAKIVEATYLGRIEEYQLSLNDKLKANASLYNPGQRGKAVGETINCCIHPEDVIPLPVDEHSLDT